MAEIFFGGVTELKESPLNFVWLPGPPRRLTHI